MACITSIHNPSWLILGLGGKLSAWQTTSSFISTNLSQAEQKTTMRCKCFQRSSDTWWKRSKVSECSRTSLHAAHIPLPELRLGGEIVSARAPSFRPSAARLCLQILLNVMAPDLTNLHSWKEDNIKALGHAGFPLLVNLPRVSRNAPKPPSTAILNHQDHVYRRLPR